MHIVLARSLAPSFNPFHTYSVTLLSAANFFLSRVERLRPVPRTDESKDVMTSLHSCSSNWACHLCCGCETLLSKGRFRGTTWH